MRLLAQIGDRAMCSMMPKPFTQGMLAMVPDHDARPGTKYVQVLIARHKFPQAREALEPLLRRDAKTDAHRIQAATIKVGLGDFASVIPNTAR